MTRRFLQALAVATAAIVYSAAPALAATQGCHPRPPCVSAVCVYKQQKPASGLCTKPKPHHSVQPANTQPTYTQTNPSNPSHVATKPKHPKHPRHPVKPVQLPDPVKASAPSAVGSALDLGLGPTALFAALLAVAALLALGGGLRGGRRR